MQHGQGQDQAGTKTIGRKSRVLQPPSRRKVPSLE